MRLFRLNKIVLKVSNNAGNFLNGLTTNTLEGAHNAFVNLHGRIIAAFDQKKSGADEFLIVTDGFVFDALMVHIQKFLMLNKTTAVKTDLKVYWDLDGAYQPQTDEWTIPQRSGQMVITPREVQVTVSDEEFTRFRLEHAIPLFGIDYQKDDFLLNVDEHQFVSYTKGCFLGQEPIAKVHNRSKPTWKLMVRSQDELTPEEQLKMTSKVMDPGQGKLMGFVFVKNM